MKEQNLLLGVVCLGIIVVMMSYTLIAPFVPGELLHRNIDPIYSGVILSCYSIVSMLMSPFIVTYFIPRFKYFRLFLAGLGIIGVSMIAFGLCYFISNNTLFVLLNVTVRIIQGVGMAFIFQVGITMLTIVFKDRLARVTSIRMVAGNVGLGLGPSIGGLLYSWLGYLGPFLIIGSLVLLVCLVFKVLISIEKFEEILVEEEKQEETTDSVVKYKTFCQEKMSMMGLIGIFMCFQFLTFFEPILADRLELDFDYDSDQVAYFYSIFTLSAFFIGLVLIIFPLKSSFPQWSAFAYFLGLIALLMMGPSNWIGLPDSEVLMGIGLFILSCCTQTLRVSSIVMILDPLKSKYPDHIHRISQLMGAYNEIIIGLSFLVTPLYSSAIYRSLGYKEVCNILAVVVLSVLIMLCFVAGVNRRGQRQRVLNQLRVPLLGKKESQEQALQQYNL